MAVVLGGCLCGAVRTEASGSPYRVGICHCLDCRKHHGAIFHTYAVFAAEAVSVQGETRQHRDRHTCARCGSPVFALYGDEIEIPTGSLDQPNLFRPTYEIWTIRREPWLPDFPIDPGRRYERDRTNDARSEGEVTPVGL